MTNQRFVSGTRFFTEALLITAFLCGVTIIVGCFQRADLSLWWMLLAAPFFFGFSCTALMLSGSVMVENE
ncbi:hypothetical protein ACLD9I_004718 [Pseudomonas aeruginosa]